MIWELEFTAHNKYIGNRHARHYWTFTTEELAIDWAMDWVKDMPVPFHYKTGKPLGEDLEACIKKMGKKAVMLGGAWKDFGRGTESYFHLDKIALYGEGEGEE